MVDWAKPGSSKPLSAEDPSRGRKGALITFHQLRTTPGKASLQKQIIANAFDTAPRKPVVDAFWAALSRTPVVQRRLSPLFLRRVSSFEVCCQETEVFPKHINQKGFYLPIHEKKTLRLAEPLCLDEDRPMLWGHALRDNTTMMEGGSVFLAGLNNASLLNDGTIIRTYDNILLCDSEYHPYIVNGVFGRRPPTVIPHVDLKLSGEYLHLGTVWSGNYYHWVLDVLSRLLFAERFDRLRAIPMIVQRGITQTHRESLEILGIPPDRIIEFSGHHWQVEQLYYIQPGWTLNPWVGGSLRHVQELRERFALHSLTHPTRRLYISREDATSRRIINETDLMKELVLYGFEVVTLSGMSFADQIRLFNEAEIIVGPHGAGFTNAVFAPPGTTLIELFSPSWMNGCFWALANACGHRYGFMIGTQHGEDVEADIGKFLRLLTSMNLDAIPVSDVRRRTPPPS